MGPCRRVSFAIFKVIHLVQGEICWCFSPIVMRKIPVIFLMKLVKMPQKISSMSSSLIFSVLRIKYNISITLFLFWKSKQTDLVQYWQLNRSSLISQCINLWLEKPSISFGVIYLSESCWTIFKISIHCFWNPFPLSYC